MAWDAAGGGAGIAVYRMVNPSSPTPVATASGVDSSGVVTLSLNISSGGAGVGTTQQDNGGTNTWVGLTEDYEVDINTTEYFSSAFGTVAGTPRTITATSTDTTPDGMSGCSASWA